MSISHEARKYALTDEIRRKIDWKLEILLEMSDDEIFKQLSTKQPRLSRKIQKKPKNFHQENPQHFKRLFKGNLEDIQHTGFLPKEISEIILFDPKSLEPIVIPATVWFSGNYDDLCQFGITVRSHIHDIFSITGTPEQLLELAQQRALHRIELLSIHPLGFNQIENNVTQTEIDQVQKQRPGHPHGYQGSGVILGIIDTPLDIAHHAFRNPKPPFDSRVLYYWDANSSLINSPRSPEKISGEFKGLNYGQLYVKKDIDIALNRKDGKVYGNNPDQLNFTIDTMEHGTYVASVAAGNGIMPGGIVSTHIGAAPEADIVFVTKGAELQDAISFIFKVADKENKPVVINYSSGGAWGFRLGLDLDSKTIDELLNNGIEGRALVGITQNWNNEGIFTRGSLKIGGEDKLEVEGVSASIVEVNILYTRDTSENIDEPQVEYQITINNDSSGWKKSFFLGKVDNTFVKVHDEKLSDVLQDNSELPRTYRRLRVLRDSITSGSLHPIIINLRNIGKTKRNYFAWIISSSTIFNGKFKGAFKDELSICDIGCCRSMITVGETFFDNPPNPSTAEKIIETSCAGPTLDGRIKPEIVAPSGITMMANSDPNDANKRDYSSGGSGTSFAAPLVSGAVALLFEEVKTNYSGYLLNYDEIKSLLTQNTNSSGLNFNIAVSKDRNLYGYGRLRMVNAVDTIRPPNNVDIWIRTADDDYGREPRIIHCYWAAPDIRVFKPGSNDATNEIMWNTPYEVIVTVRNLGIDKAQGTQVRLYYTRAWVAPNKWHLIEEKINIEVPALHQTDVKFPWTPDSNVAKPAPGETHFCLLAEAYHPDEKNYEKNIEKDDAWELNIKKHRYLALRNVVIK